MNLTTKHFTSNLNLFDTVSVQPCRKLLEDHQEKNFTMNQARNPCNVDFDTRKFCLLYKIFKENKLFYLFNLIPSKNSNYNTINTDKITPFHTKHNFFKNYFFPSTVIESNRLDPNLRSATSLSVFKKNLLKFVRSLPKSVFNCHNCKGIKYLTRLRLGLSYLHEHKFKHSFQNTLNPFLVNFVLDYFN